MYYSNNDVNPLLIFAITLPFFLFIIISFWKLFEKAGQPGWASIVPIYNAITLLKIAKKEWWWIFLFIVPIANIIVLVKMWHAISLAFGKSTGFTVGLVLLGVVFIPILAFSDAQYGPEKISGPHTPLDQI